MAKCGHCRDCKWWNRTQNYSLDDPNKVGKIENDYYFRELDYYFCDLTEMTEGKFQQLSMARAIDSEGTYAHLATEPDFGCVQWEAKDV